MASLDKRFNDLKDKVSKAKAELSAANERKIKLIAKLKEKKIEPEDLEKEIERLKKTKEDLEESIELKLKEAESVFED